MCRNAQGFRQIIFDIPCLPSSLASNTKPALDQAAFQCHSTSNTSARQKLMHAASLAVPVRLAWFDAQQHASKVMRQSWNVIPCDCTSNALSRELGFGKLSSLGVNFAQDHAKQHLDSKTRDLEKMWKKASKLWLAFRCPSLFRVAWFDAKRTLN